VLRSLIESHFEDYQRVGVNAVGTIVDHWDEQLRYACARAFSIRTRRVIAQDNVRALSRFCFSLLAVACDFIHVIDFALVLDRCCNVSTCIIFFFFWRAALDTHKIARPDCRALAQDVNAAGAPAASHSISARGMYMQLLAMQARLEQLRSEGGPVAAAAGDILEHISYI
jgi:hypothetical protein